MLRHSYIFAVTFGSLLAVMPLDLLHAQSKGDYLMRTGFPLNALNNVDVRDARVAAKHLLKEIVEDYGVRYTTEVLEVEEDFYRKLAANQYDFFIIFAYDYIRLREEYPMRPVLVGQHSETELLQEYLLITKSEIKSIADLSDKRLLIQRGAGKLPMLWLEETCADQGHNIAEGFFKEVEEANNVSQAILPVFFGKAQACLVSRGGFETMNELNPQIGNRLRIHLRSKPFLTSILCFRPEYVEKEPGLLVREGLKLNEQPKGQQLLTLFRTKRLHKFDPKYLESVAELLQARSARLNQGEQVTAAELNPEDSD